MVGVSYHKLALDWTPKSKRDIPFTLFATLLLALAMAGAGYMGSIDVPKKERQARVAVPERVAKYILNKPKPKPKPKPPKPKPKPKPPKLPKAKPTVERKPTEIKVPLTPKQKQDRKRAEQSGLLALSNELADLMDTSLIDAQVGRLNQSQNTTEVASVNTDILSSNSTRGSGGVRASDHISGTGGRTALSAQNGSAARALLDKRAGRSKGKKPSSSAKNRRVGNYRSQEDIAYTMDRNKSKLHRLYRRARRSNPGIRGKIVLEITILPSGKVVSVRIKSSELNDKALEASIIARIKRFDFGVSNVKKVTVIFPVEFLPS